MGFLLILPVLIFNQSPAAAFPLLRVPVGARACAMGETFTGMADDVNAIFYNPGGLGYLNEIQLALAHHRWFADINDENLNIALPLGPGTFGLSGVFSRIGGIENWDPNTGQLDTFAVNSGYAVFGYGVRINKMLAVGGSAKWLYDALPEQKGIGFCFDAGAVYRFPAGLSVGVATQNLGPGIKYGGERFPLPVGVRLGAGYGGVLSKTGNGLRLLTDVNIPLSGKPDFHLGAEFALEEFLVFRCGYRLGPQDWRSLGLLSGLTAGLGINAGRIGLDYAFVPYGPLGVTHRFALRTGFYQRRYGRVRIRVIETGSGKPVSGARFTVEGTHAGRSYTEENGVFVIDGVETGWVKITVEADSFYPECESLLVEPRVVTNLNFVLRRMGFGSLWGAVYSRVGNRPVAADVRYRGPDSGVVQTSSVEGSFVLRKLPAGDYQFEITPRDSGYQRMSDTLTILPGQLRSRVFIVDFAIDSVESKESNR